MKRYFTVLTVLIASFFDAQSQHDFNYELQLTAVSVNNLPGLHSFAFGQHHDKWVLIGGRRDGLHARQPFASFPELDNNTDLYVVDINTKQVWSASISGLPTNLKEQLQSTNMNFHQLEDTLYLIGGYGYSNSKSDHITYPYLTTINVSGLIDDVINNKPIDGNFKQLQDSIFEVCGGQLSHLEDKLYLVGGQTFTGRYNPMGHNTYVQSYTNEIRSFKVDNSGKTPRYSDYKATNDPVHLRRRDYNLLPQVYPDGTKGLMISSGVFQSTVDLPFLYPVEIKTNSHTPRTSFNQYLSNYHSARVSLFDSSSKSMHMLFFGGMSQYYYQDSSLVKDDKVPFVKTISRVSRNASNELKEFQLNQEMPGLIGASAEFIPQEGVLFDDIEVVKLPISTDTILIGHIVGGIQSPSLNPFSSNQTSSTNAHETIYEVALIKSQTQSSQPIDGGNPYQVKFTPNPVSTQIGLAFNTLTNHHINYFVTASNGQMLQQGAFEIQGGNNAHQIDLDESISSQTLFVTIVFDSTYFVTETIIKR